MSFLSRISLANRSVVALITVAILIVGGFLIPSLKQELFPSLSFPAITVITPYMGAAPDVVERDITNPLEQNIQGIDGLEELTSYSNEGVSIIIASFDYGVDLDQAKQTLGEQIDSARSSLPADADPTLQAFNINDLPIITLAAGSDESEEELALRLQRDVVPLLEGIEGIGTVNLTGVRDEIVTIRLDLRKLQENGLTVEQVQGVLQANNLTIPAGTTTSDDQTMPIKVGYNFTSLEDLENLIVGVRTAPGSQQGETPDPAQPPTPPVPVRLVDVAKVQQELAPSSSLTRTNGEPTIGLSIVKSTSGNTVSISHAVKEQLNELEDKLGSGGELTVVSDQAPYIETSIEDLVREGLIGAGFAIIVILVFLLSIRSTVVTAVSIPLSIVIALIGIYLGNYTLNMLTLGGLTIAIGRVVDDSIVVLENIYRHLQSGEKKDVAIPRAVREVGGAITASTLTTVAVFLPLAFTGGLVGTMFNSFSVAVTVALLASLLVSLTIIPVLAYWFLKSPAPDKIQPLDSHEKSTALERGYVALVSWVTGRVWQRIVTLLIAVAILGGSFYLATGLQTNLFGESGQNSYSVSLTMPPGTSLDATNEAALRVEEALDEVKNIETYQVAVGSGGMLSSLSGGGGASSATFTIVTEEGVDQAAFEEELREELEKLTNVGTLAISAGESGGFGGSEIQVNVQASDDETLREATDEVEAMMQDAPGLIDINNNLSNSVPQIEITVDPQKALQYGQTAAQVAQSVRSIYSGSSVTTITLDGTQQEVQIWYGEPGTTVEEIRAMQIPTAAGNIPLSQLATVEESNGPTQISHTNTDRTATISATITDSNVGAVSADIQQRLTDLDLPNGAEAAIGGVATDQQETFQQLGLAVLIAILLVYCIMVATFRSLLQPLILLISIPFATTGSIILLLITGIPLGATALIGFLMLVGIVVTNAIVLLDLVRQCREQGMNPREAMIEGGRRRLRPILMTAIATILALAPMAIGLSSSGGFISQPLALVVIGGLTSSTLLTLILVPTLYVIISGGGSTPQPPVEEPATEEETATEADPALA